MYKRYFSILVEFSILLVSGVFIYLEKLFRLLKPEEAKSIEGEVILITGAANGLGRAICTELVQYRAKLVLWDISEEDNKRTAQELIDLGAEYVYCDTVDVSDRNQIVAAAKRLRNNFGDVAILVNNAGICPMQKFHELTPESVQPTIKINLLAHFWTIQEFLPQMLQNNKGHVVTICSTMGQMAIRGPAPYYATKHAVHGFIECLKDELAHSTTNPNIKFTTVYPFFIKTRMVEGSNCGLHLKFRFPSITPFMEASEVAKRVVNGIRHESEFLYIPETFRIYLAGKFLLPSKLHRMAVDFFVDESDYSVELGTANGFQSALANSEVKSITDSNSTMFTNELDKTPLSWLSGNIKEKEK